MNLSKYRINILLKFTLIFSIILNLVNSVSANNSSEASKKISELNLDIPIFVTLIIFFIYWYFNKNKQQKQFDKFEEKYNEIVTNLDRLNGIDNKLNNLDIIKREIIKQVQETNQKITNSKKELIEFINKRQATEPVNSYSNAGIKPTNHYGFPTSADEQIEHQLDIPSYNSVAVIEHIPQFIETYNLEKKSLADKTIATVVATEESLNRRRLGDEGKLTLENTTQKKYLIVQEDNDFYLVPHAKINIDEYNITTLEALFECIHFTPEYSDFHLIQPAKVSQLDSELWQLDKKGKLEFS